MGKKVRENQDTNGDKQKKTEIEKGRRKAEITICLQAKTSRQRLKK